MRSRRNSNILFWLGIAGIVFYVLAPILFPGVPNLRQPELLPVYTLCVGLGQLLRGTEIVQEQLKEAEEGTEDQGGNQKPTITSTEPSTDPAE